MFGLQNVKYNLQVKAGVAPKIMCQLVSWVTHTVESITRQYTQYTSTLYTCVYWMCLVCFHGFLKEDVKSIVSNTVLFVSDFIRRIGGQHLPDTHMFDHLLGLL